MYMCICICMYMYIDIGISSDSGSYSDSYSDSDSDSDIDNHMYSYISTYVQLQFYGIAFPGDVPHRRDRASKIWSWLCEGAQNQSDDIVAERVSGVGHVSSGGILRADG